MDTQAAGHESRVRWRVDRYPVIVGPTAGGKTAVAVELAFAFERAGRGPGEVVTADAFQVYRGMDIGTAKPTAQEQRGVLHHLIDLVEPTERFTVHDWLMRAEPVIQEIRDRGRTPIVVGGTNLYVKAFLDGLFDGPQPSEAVKAEVAAMSQPDRRAELERVDARAFLRIHASDVRRTVRALEVFRETGTPISVLQAQWDAERVGRPDAVLVGLDWNVDALNRRINARVKAMLEGGLVEEARGLFEGGRLGDQAREAIGYKQLLPVFEGRQSLEDARERVKIETRRLGKNQRTWLRRLSARPGSVWIPATDEKPEDIAQSIVSKLFSES
ncbi:MAG: tRNA (adenosine(37)-N6)-dimethylallyltransferase MiaA [Phycisphaerales bacterium]